MSQLFLSCCLCSAVELTAIKDYHDPTILDVASKVLYHFNRVPRLQQRMECHEIAFNWFNTANGVFDQLSLILKAQDELVSSQKSMEIILAMVLSIGNYINGDTARGQVSIGRKDAGGDVN